MLLSIRQTNGRSCTAHGTGIIFPGTYFPCEFTQIKVSPRHNGNHAIVPTSVNCIECRRAYPNVIVNPDKYVCTRIDKRLRQHIPRDRHICATVNVVLNLMTLRDQNALNF